MNAYAVAPSPFQRSQSSNHALTLNLMTAADYQSLQKTANDLSKALASYPGLTNVDAGLSFDNRQFNLVINRNLAADLNVDVNDVTNTIATLLGTAQPTSFEYDGQDYNVEVGMNADSTSKQDFSVMDRIYIRNAQNKMLPLASLITVEPVIGPATLEHYNRLRTASLSAEIAPGYSLGDVVSYLQHYLPKNLPTTVQYEFSGAAKDYLDSANRMNLIFGLAMLFIFLTLAAQFESFIDPFIVLLTVPFSIIGGLIALHLTKGSINIYTQIGLVSLIGLIAKHGILITEFANKIRAQGKDIAQAVTEAAVLRLRPILMTTGAMVLGALPLALATGAGSASRQQIGWVIVGGMLCGTFFSLIVIPVAYSYLAKLTRSDRVVE
jgi:multidrug efflux pump subunit AcrB